MPPLTNLIRLRITSRIYLGFGALILIGLGVAGFGSVKLREIGSQVDHMMQVSESGARNLQERRLIETMRRTKQLFKSEGDETAIAEFAKAKSAAIDLLAASAKATLSDERRRLYESVIVQLGEVGESFAKLVALG